METIKHLLIEAAINVANWAAVYAAGLFITFAHRVLKSAKQKTMSYTMAEIYSIADTVIASLQPKVDEYKKDGKFTKNEAMVMKSLAVKEIKEQLNIKQMKLIKAIAKDSNFEDKILYKLVELALNNRKNKILPNHFYGIRFDWKF